MLHKFQIQEQCEELVVHPVAEGESGRESALDIQRGLGERSPAERTGGER
jgi:hypothetical protein